MKLFLLFFSLLYIYPHVSSATQFEGSVVRVLDGDTIEVLREQNPVRVRLLNIDAPEKKQLLDAGQPINLKRFSQDNPLAFHIRKQIGTGEYWDEW
jgi:endonuclease YncB( thermonuclease family)